MPSPLLLRLPSPYIGARFGPAVERGQGSGVQVDVDQEVVNLSGLTVFTKLVECFRSEKKIRVTRKINHNQPQVRNRRRNTEDDSDFVHIDWVRLGMTQKAPWQFLLLFAGEGLACDNNAP